MKDDQVDNKTIRSVTPSETKAAEREQSQQKESQDNYLPLRKIIRKAQKNSKI